MPNFYGIMPDFSMEFWLNAAKICHDDLAHANLWLMMLKMAEFRSKISRSMPDAKTARYLLLKVK
jgi:hypothetical protein